MRPGGAARSGALKCTDRTLENRIYRIELDANGDICSIRDKRCNRELVADGKAFRLAVFEGNPSNRYPAWEIMKATMDQTPNAVNGDVRITVVEEGPVRATLKVERTYGPSAFVQYVSLTDGGMDDRIDIRNRVDWAGRDVLLKAEFPCAVANEKAAYDLGLGFLERGNNTELAYEVPAHKWADLTAADASYGVSILNDCKYGISADGSNLRLTLHKSGTHPDVTGDKGVHEVTYSFLPHNSAFSADSVIKPAYLLNYPVICENGVLEHEMKPIVATDCDNIVCEAIKPAELRDDAFVARFYEAERCRTNAKIYVGEDVKHVYRTNILEDIKSEMKIQDGAFSYSFRPFEIATFMFVK